MLKSFLLLLFVSSLQFSCRTTGGKSDTWNAQDNRTAAINYIKFAVVELFPDVSEGDPALQEFAVALQDETSKKLESAEYLLRKYNEQRRTNPNEINTEIAGYIAEHFLSMTNYIAIFQKEAKELKYIGFDGTFASISE